MNKLISGLILGTEDPAYNRLFVQRLTEKMRKVFEAENFLYHLVTLADRVRDLIQSSDGVSMSTILPYSYDIFTNTGPVQYSVCVKLISCIGI